MKRALILSLVAIFLLIMLSAALSRATSKKIEIMLDITRSMPNNIKELPQSDMEKLVNEWNTHRKALSMIVKKDYIITTDLAVHTLESTTAYGTECEYLCAKKTLIVALETLLACLGLSPSSFL